MSDMNTEYEAYVRVFKQRHPNSKPTPYTIYKMQRDRRDREKAEYDAKVEECAKLGIVYRRTREGFDVYEA
jgi:uncharacterized short protein YbdD (DUF466 family)